MNDNFIASSSSSDRRHHQQQQQSTSGASLSRILDNGSVVHPHQHASPPQHSPPYHHYGGDYSNERGRDYYHPRPIQKPPTPQQQHHQQQHSPPPPPPTHNQQQEQEASLSLMMLANNQHYGSSSQRDHYSSKDGDQMSDVEMAVSAISSLSDTKPDHSQMNDTSQGYRRHPEHNEPYSEEMRGEDNSVHHQMPGQPNLEYHPNDLGGGRKHSKRLSNGSSQLLVSPSRIPQKDHKVITKRSPQKRRLSNANDYRASGGSKLNDLRELSEERKSNNLIQMPQGVGSPPSPVDSKSLNIRHHYLMNPSNQNDRYQSKTSPSPAHVPNGFSPGPGVGGMVGAYPDMPPSQPPIQQLQSNGQMPPMREHLGAQILKKYADMQRQQGNNSGGEDHISPQPPSSNGALNRQSMVPNGSPSMNGDHGMVNLSMHHPQVNGNGMYAPCVESHPGYPPIHQQGNPGYMHPSEVNSQGMHPRRISDPPINSVPASRGVHGKSSPVPPPQVPPHSPAIGQTSRGVPQPQGHLSSYHSLPPPPRTSSSSRLLQPVVTPSHHHQSPSQLEPVGPSNGSQPQIMGHPLTDFIRDRDPLASAGGYNGNRHHPASSHSNGVGPPPLSHQHS
ncbi:14846_t:CDS:2, partial [Acaulospora colombiana]